jgi:hypothetical protein
MKSSVWGKPIWPVLHPPFSTFSGESTIPLRKTVLPVLTGPVNLQTEFIVIKASSPYNVIIGHDWLTE